MFQRLMLWVTLAAGLVLPAEAESVSVAGEWINVVTHQGVHKGSPYNPGNQLARLPSTVVDSTLRLDLRGRAADLNLGLGPRLAYWEAHGRPEGGGRQRQTSAYLQHWQLSWRPDPYEVFYTRESMLWGPSLLASPSNPFFRNVDRTNPMIELPSRDFIGVRAQLSDRDRVGLVGNVGRGRDAIASHDFRRTLALHYERTGDDYAFGAVLSGRSGALHLGGYGQYTINDATLFYADAAWLREPERLVVLGPSDAPLLGQRTDARRHRADLLLGGSYTLASGPTVNLEYRYNGAGYDAGERRALGRYASTNAARLAQGDPAGATALGAVVRPYSSTWGRHYAHVQYHQRFSGRTAFVGLLQYGLDAHDLSATLMLTHDVGDRLRLMASAVVYGGPSYQGSQRYMKHLLFLGAKLSF